VQGSAVGSCSVTAVQASDGNYQAAQSSPISIVVQAVPTIPTLSGWGLLFLASMLALVTRWRLRRQTMLVNSAPR
jgi:hypothetical protein